MLKHRNATDILNLQRELATLRAQVPVRIGITTSGPVPITIIGGQTIGTFGGITTYGIKRFAGTLAAITTQTYDPGTVDTATGEQTGAPSPAITAWPLGIGFGTLFNSMVYSRVIVVNDNRGTMATLLIGGASDDTTYVPSFRQVTVLCQRQVGVTKADGTSVRAYAVDLG